MHVLTVGYGQPADPAAFDDYYDSIHRPLALKLPGLQSFTARHCASLDDSPPPYYLVAELAFTSGEALAARSPHLRAKLLAATSPTSPTAA